MRKLTKPNIIMLNNMRRVHNIHNIHNNHVSSNFVIVEPSQQDVINFYKSYDVSQDVLKALYPHLFENKIITEEEEVVQQQQEEVVQQQEEEVVQQQEEEVVQQQEEVVQQRQE